MTEYEIELRDKLIKHLNLEDFDLEAITSDTFLFGEGLELDSIDAIEIEVMIKAEYDVDILASERNRATFGTLGSLSRFIQQKLGNDI